MMSCASCGKSELDDVKLMDCDGCKSVRYCGDACKKDHWPEHEEKCKEYQAAELRDEILFRQPESTHQGDCPICCVPLPIEDEKIASFSCCSKVVCHGCAVAEGLRQLGQRRGVTCPFCRQRQSFDRTDEETKKNLMKRVAANDPAALLQMGTKHAQREEYNVAFEYLTKAAEFGDADAHFNLSVMYKNGHGVEKDEKKRVYHLEEAAIAGHPDARYNLASYEEDKGKADRAVKHLIIAANLGHNPSMKSLKEYYKDGDVSKEDFAAALRGHHAAVSAMKSPQRKAVERTKTQREAVELANSHS